MMENKTKIDLYSPKAYICASRLLPDYPCNCDDDVLTIFRRIVSMANSTDVSERNTAFCRVHDILNPLENKIMNNYNIKEKDDCRQEFFLVIMENLKDWEPEKGFLTTYFRYFFQEAARKYELSTHSYSISEYAGKIMNKIRVIVYEFENANQDFTEDAVFEKMTINVSKATFHDLYTRICTEQTSSPYDVELLASDSLEYGGNPVDTIIRNEEMHMDREVIMNLMDKIDTPSRDYIESEYQHYLNGSSDRYTPSDYRDEAAPDLTPIEARSCAKRAHRLFKARCSRIYSSNPAFTSRRLA